MAKEFFKFYIKNYISFKSNKKIPNNFGTFYNRFISEAAASETR